MARGKTRATYEELMKLAKEHGVENNALFIAAADQYDLQINVIKKIRDQIDASDALTCEKVYRGKEKNEYAAPLLREMPRHMDSANKTLAVMLEIINKLGKPAKKESALSAFEKEFD